MRQFTCGQKSASVLGFGCGSVLGRVGRRDSLHAMHCAWEAGITLFETAPGYGFGHAEAALGEFLRGRRDQATVITKYGILPQASGCLNTLAVPVARAAAKFVPSALLRHRKQHRNRPVRHGEFSAAGLRLSVEVSLHELQTDHLDILLLHQATMEALHQLDLVAELDILIRQGKILSAGLYAERVVVAAALIEAPSPFSVMECAADLFQPALAKQSEPRGTLLIGNHPFQTASDIAQVTSILEDMRSDQAVPFDLRRKLRTIDWALVLPAVLGSALSAAGFDALIFSMMQADHVRMNVQAIECNPFSKEELSLIFRTIQHAAGSKACSQTGTW